MKDAVRQIIATADPCGGVVIAPTHVLEPDVPWDNIIALSQIMGEFGHPMPACLKKKLLVSSEE